MGNENKCFAVIKKFLLYKVGLCNFEEGSILYRNILILLQHVKCVQLTNPGFYCEDAKGNTACLQNKTCNLENFLVSGVECSFQS